MQLDAGQLLQGLSIVVAVMIIVVLYHILFIVVDVRKITRRMESLTDQVEAVILKPLSLTDQFFTWIMDHIEKKKKKGFRRKDV